MNSDPCILFVKPKAIQPRDKKLLQEIGVVVVEVVDPADVKFTRAYAELSGSELLAIAFEAIATNTQATAAKTKFGELLIDAYLGKHPRPKKEPAK